MTRREDFLKRRWMDERQLRISIKYIVKLLTQVCTLSCFLAQTIDKKNVSNYLNVRNASSCLDIDLSACFD